MAKKIKPCPFCGSAASPRRLIQGYYQIVCENDDCPSHYKGWLTEKLAIDAWNMRLKPHASGK